MWTIPRRCHSLSIHRTETPIFFFFFFLDRQVRANSVNPDQTADQGLHFLPFCLCVLNALQQCSNFKVFTAIFRVSEVSVLHA